MRILLTGASGYLGCYVRRELERAGWEVDGWCGHESPDAASGLRAVDLTDSERVRSAYRDSRPGVIVHAAALASVADCRNDPERARAVNIAGTAMLAELAADAGTRFIHISTDMVFDGSRGSYREEDVPSPLSIYGQTKAAAEQIVRALPDSVILRICLLFGPTLGQRKSFFDQQVRALRNTQTLSLFEDEWRTPLSCPTAARAVRAVADSNVRGLFHLGGPARLSRLEMGRRLARRLGISDATIVAIRREQQQAAVPRPRDLSLDSTRWRRLFPHLPWPNFDDALAEMEL